jgi:hypothetical protein
MVRGGLGPGARVGVYRAPGLELRECRDFRLMSVSAEEELNLARHRPKALASSAWPKLLHVDLDPVFC